MKSREKDMRDEMRAKEGGKGGWGMGDVLFFYLRPSRSRVSLCSPLEKESLLTD